MKSKLLVSFLVLTALGSGAALSGELKPYQKDALKQLEASHGPTIWPMVRQQYEAAIGNASEEETKAIVKAITQARGNAASGQSASSSNESDESDADDAYEKAEAAREDLEKQVNPTYNAFIEFIAQVSATRGKIGDQARGEIYQAEKGARLQAVSDTVTQDKFITNRSIADGMTEARLAREKLFKSKKFYKVVFSPGNPPDTTEAVRAIVRNSAERIRDLNNEYGKIAADIKKRIDAIPYGGGVDVNKALKALMDERERHNKILSDQVRAIVQEMNNKIADEDKKIFEWILKPLREAQVQSGPVAAR